MTAKKCWHCEREAARFYLRTLIDWTMAVVWVCESCWENIKAGKID